MDVREKLIGLIAKAKYICANDYSDHTEDEYIADTLLDNGVTVQECAYWQYVEDDVDEDNNIQAYCSVCGAGDKHATSMIGKVPYCWKCGRKMMPQPPKGE